MSLCGDGWSDVAVDVLNSIELGSDSLLGTETTPLHYLSISLVILGLLSLITNVLMMVVLRRSGLTEMQTKFHQHFVYLTATEIAFVVSFVCHHLIRLMFQSVVVFCSRTCLILCLFLISVETVALGTRNWIIAAIAVSRCLIVSRALGSVRRVSTPPCMLKMSIAILLILNVILVQFKNYSMYSSIVCDTDDQVTDNMTYSEPMASSTVGFRYQEIVVVSLIRGLPVICVVVCTIVILSMLLSREKQVQSQTAIMSATKVLLVVTVFFTAFEGFSYCFALTWELCSIKIQVFLYLYMLDKFLMVANSTATITPYILFNKDFRGHLITVLKSCRLRRSRRIQQTPIVTRYVPENNDLKKCDKSLS